MPSDGSAGSGLPAGVQGASDPNFVGAIRTFAGLFPARQFGGGTLAVYIDGRPVVDVWMGLLRCALKYAAAHDLRSEPVELPSSEVVTFGVRTAR